VEEEIRMSSTELYDTFLDAHIPLLKYTLSKHPVAEEALLECVIVEPRPHPRLLGVVANVSANFPNAAITILHSKMHALPRELDEAPNIQKVVICEENLSRSEYSRLLASYNLWSKVLKSPYTLVFQTDTGVRKNSILHYLQYDYVGAPWQWMVWGSMHIQIGNGGFSLRNRRLMAEITKKFEKDLHASWEDPVTREKGEAEDIFFARHLVHWERAQIPTYDVASSFSMEHNLHSDPLGFHRLYDMHPPLIVQELLEPCINRARSADAQMQLLQVQDAWVLTQRGRVYRSDVLVKWLSLGISAITNKLHIPKDTKLPIPTESIPEDDSGIAKHLCIKVSTQAKVYVIPLYQMCIRYDFEL
jgi:Protein of unknown function (DUF5672)